MRRARPCSRAAEGSMFEVAPRVEFVAPVVDDELGQMMRHVGQMALARR